MKRILLIILGIIGLSLTACSSKEVTVESVCKYYTNLESYESTATMNMYRGNDVVTFNVNASYLKPSYYKVEFSNGSNNNEQIIVKNDDGVYVLTPTLNKQFKFDSSWPLNSSHAYLISAIVKDITNDNEAIINENDGNFTIQSKIAHKVNQNLTYMRFTCSNDYEPISCNFYNNNDEKQIEVNFTKFTKDIKLTSDDFNPEKLMDEKTNSLGEGKVESVSGSLSVGYLVENDNDLEVVVYSDRVVATYDKEVNYVVVSQTIEATDNYAPLRIYDDLSFESLGVVAINDNSISFIYKNQQISIYSDSLNSSELVEVANTITFN